MDLAQTAGWLGTALILTAYAPQVWHLAKEKCAAGLSMISWHLWLLGSLLLFAHAYARADAVIMAAQSVNLLAVGLTLYLAKKYEGKACASCQIQPHPTMQVRPRGIDKRKHYKPKHAP